jgi:hypothetical protein
MTERERRLPQTPDIAAILATLARHEVDYVVIGGVAVAHHGYVRATKDVDVVPGPSEENLGRLWDALVELDAEPLALGDLRPQELPAQFTLERLLELGNWDLATRHGRVDVMQFLAGKLEAPEDYDGLRRRADEARFDFGTVRFVAYEDLLDLKNLAGRDQDLIDVRALRQARGDSGPE